MDPLVAADDAVATSAIKNNIEPVFLFINKWLWNKRGELSEKLTGKSIVFPQKMI
jgi:hypothetical protein